MRFIIFYKAVKHMTDLEIHDKSDIWSCQMHTSRVTE